MNGSNRESADVVIIGGGIMGTSLAWQLARRGAGRVTLLERAVVAAGASGKTGALLRRHPRTQVIWAHCGLGRVVRPAKDQLWLVARALDDPALAHVSIDLSWDETAKYLVASPESVAAAAEGCVTAVMMPPG